MILQILLISFLGFSQSSKDNYWPQGPCDQILENHYYTVCYSYDHRQALWAHHQLTIESIKGKHKRKDNFRKDKRVTFPVGSKDYRGSGYDRGHMVPAADMKLSKLSMSETFFMTNMSPQNPSMNRGLWASLENKVRSWVLKDGMAYVITAPLLAENLPMIKSQVSIPDYYYKIIYFEKKKIMKAFLVPNRKPSDKNFYQYSISVDELEVLTGLDFFSELPDHLEEKLEAINYYSS